MCFVPSFSTITKKSSYRSLELFLLNAKTNLLQSHVVKPGNNISRTRTRRWESRDAVGLLAQKLHARHDGVVVPAEQ